MRTLRLPKLAALAVLILLVGSNLILPAGAHVTRRLPHLLQHLNPRYINTNEKAADADLLDGQDSTAFLGVNAKAADADLLDGQDSTAFLGANAKAADADLLDGIDSTGFVQGGGRAVGQALAESPGDHLFLGPPIAGFLRLSYACPATLLLNGTLIIYNDSGSLANVFVESGEPNPTYHQMNPGDQIPLPALAAGDSFHIQAQGALGILTIEAATVHRASDCHAQAQGLLTS
jgi:hypothetical protein